jgi:rod shape-determining protein MreD
MSRLLFGLMLAFVVLLQAAVFPAIESIQVMPDLTLALLLVWSALRGTPEGLLWAFGVGIMMDVLAMDRLGTNGLALLGVALLGGLSRRRFFHNTLIFPIFLVVVATFLHAVVLLLLRSSAGAGAQVGAAMRLVFLQALLNVIFLPPLYLIAGWMERRIALSHA